MQAYLPKLAPGATDLKLLNKQAKSVYDLFQDISNSQISEMSEVMNEFSELKIERGGMVESTDAIKSTGGNSTDTN